MAEPPHSHVIEYARSGRSTCQSCRKPIADKELRLLEAFVTDEGNWARSHKNARTRPRSYDDDGNRRYEATPDVVARFHHLPCAAKHQPYKLRSALATTELEIPHRAELEQAIERGLSVVDAAETNPETRDKYEQFIEDVREARDDEGLLVFADWLQSVSDPRGELIATQRALETATGDERIALVKTEERLLAAHRKQFLPDRLEGKLEWRRGFVQRLTITATLGLEPITLGRALAHPSFRVLRELAVTVAGAWNQPLVIAANLPKPLPITLRLVKLSGEFVGEVGEALADSLPQLEELVISGPADLERLRHPTLASLELDCPDASRPMPSTPRAEPQVFTRRIAGLHKKRLPELRRFVLVVDRGLDAAVTALAETTLLPNLHELVLRGDLSAAGVASLVAKKKLHLHTVDVRGCTRIGPQELASLVKLADTVVRDEAAPAPVEVPQAKITEWLVRHTRKPEWGIGRVISEGDNGMEVEFEHGGTKQVRNVELLEEIERPS